MVYRISLATRAPGQLVILPHARTMNALGRFGNKKGVATKSDMM